MSFLEVHNNFFKGKIALNSAERIWEGARSAQSERKASKRRGRQDRDAGETQPTAWRTRRPGPRAERLQRLPGLAQLGESYLGLYYAKSCK